MERGGGVMRRKRGDEKERGDDGEGGGVMVREGGNGERWG